MIDFNFTKVGSPVFSYQNLIPCVTLNGSSQYLTVDTSSDSRYNLTGAVTMGAWVRTDVFTTAQAIMGRWGSSQQGYLLSIVNDDTVKFEVSASGSNTFSVLSTDLMTIDVWTFIVGRYTPSTELALWVNTTKTTNVTSIPASLHLSTAAFYLGFDVLTSRYFDGFMSLAFICGDALPDRTIELLYDQTKAMFYGISTNA
jgi:hypothetical protein